MYKQKLCQQVHTVAAAVLNTFMPRTCPVCDNSLTVHDDCICLSCLARLPRTGLEADNFNILHQRLGNQVPVDKALAWFWYYKGDDITSVIIDAKYHDRPRLIRNAARQYASELSAAGLSPASFADVIVPTPMHWFKRMRRGYNQSEWLARGIAEVAGLPVKNCLTALRSHRTQTRLSAARRLENLRDTIALKCADEISGRRVLLVDDIITTGATLNTCLAVLARARPTTISVLVLGAAKMN